MAAATSTTNKEVSFMARRKRRGARKAAPQGALGIVRQAREAAKAALVRLRSEIQTTRTSLARLIEEERFFRSDLFGAGPGRPGRKRGRPAGSTRPGRRRRRRGGRPKQPPRAEKFFSRLGSTFTLDDVRKLAGRSAGISLAQWSRAKRIRKVGDKYHKVK
jgi:hypothetical protein